MALVRLLKWLLIILVIGLVIYGGYVIKTKDSADGTNFQIYFYQDSKLKGISRQADPQKGSIVLQALQALLQGASAEEQEQNGGQSLIPGEVKLIELDVQQGTALVTLSRDFLQISSNAQIYGALKQMVYTLTQFKQIQQVKFRVAGQTADQLIIGGEGYTIEAPLSRRDFEN